MNYSQFMKIVLASSNEHKKKEIQNLMKNHEIILPSQLGLSFDCEEDGETFLENAMIKAKSLFAVLEANNIHDYAVLADDSGLIVDALPGQLGVRTARFGSTDGVHLLSAKEKNELLLSKLKNVEDSKRSARFVCAMVFLKDKWTYYCVQESAKGKILDKEIGSHGFGYDPVFFCSEAKSPMALLSEEEKNLYSHRGKATRKILRCIE